MLETQFLAPVPTRRSASSSIVSPSAPTGETSLEHLTVGREVVLEQLQRATATAGEPGTDRFHLLIGPTGIGKSHVLALLGAHIRRSPDTESRALVATLPEQNCPTSVVQLLARLLRALPDDPELGPTVDALRSLQRQRDGDQEQRAVELIRLRLRGRRLFIVIDRLDEILAVLGAEGWSRLRSILNSETDWTLVTSARVVVPELEGFVHYPLEALTPAQCREMLARLAKAHSRVRVAELLDSDKGLARVNALHHLLGGTPGAMAMVFRRLDVDRLERIDLALVSLGDALEPHLRERTTRLSPSQRGIVDILVDSWRPLTVTEIAERSFAKQASTSGALRHLRREGLVRALERGRERYYELCDPLHRLARPERPALVFAGVVARWYAKDRSPRASVTRTRASLPEDFEQTCREAEAILGQSPSIAVGRLRGRLARSKSPVMSAALVLALEKGGRGREAIEALISIPPTHSHATHTALLRLSEALGIESSVAAGMVRAIVDAASQPDDPSRRDALLRALDEASPRLRRVLSDSILPYGLLQAWAAVGAYPALGQLLCRLRPTKTSPTLEAELLAVLESAWHARRVPELFASEGSFDGLLAIGSAQVRASLAWAGAIATLRAEGSIDPDDLVSELRRRMGLEPGIPTWPTAEQLLELGPTIRAFALELLADPRGFELWVSAESREDLAEAAETLLATGIYAWVASDRPLEPLATLADEFREVLPPALLASKTTREACARMAASERLLVREILAHRCCSDVDRGAPK